MKEIYNYKEVADIWIEYKEAVRFYILKKTKDEATTDDIFHEVLMKIYNSCCSGRKITNVRSWTFQIAHNVMVDYFKSKQKLTSSIPDVIEVSQDESFYSDAEKVIDPMLKLLPEKYSKPLKLYDIDGKKQKDIAVQLGLSLTATKSRIQRARVLLRDKIVECNVIERGFSGELLNFDLKKSCKI